LTFLKHTGARRLKPNPRNRTLLQGFFVLTFLLIKLSLSYHLPTSGADARGFALLDFNRDGWLDMVVSSPNSPRFRIFENRIHQLAKRAEANHCKIRLVGANTSASSSSKWSSRDAVGAELFVTIDNQRRAFHNSVGEGLSSQNSSWIHVGIGRKKQIDQVEVRWPSGKQRFTKTSRPAKESHCLSGIFKKTNKIQAERVVSYGSRHNLSISVIRLTYWRRTKKYGHIA